jgi:uncharacterized protein (TIGR03000 family)
MYSVVLMMAMTSGGDLPDFGHRGSSCCGGCYGSCYGGYSCCGGFSCSGGYFSSCSGYSCSGGYDCCGCCGGGHRLFGGHRHGGYSCCGGCYGGCYGGYSCCGGCYGGYSCCGGVIYGGSPGSVIITEPGKKPEEPIKKPEDKKPETLVPAPATIIVSLPADAKLTIDDAATTSTSSMRVFTSPALPVGRDFHYTLKAEFVRDGKPATKSKEVTVRAGEATRVDLNEAAAEVAGR